MSERPMDRRAEGEEAGPDQPAESSSDLPPRSPPRKRRKRRHEKFRVPAIVVLPLGPLVGWIVADVPGAVIGLLVGFVAWRARS